MCFPMVERGGQRRAAAPQMHSRTSAANSNKNNDDKDDKDNKNRKGNDVNSDNNVKMNTTGNNGLIDSNDKNTYITIIVLIVLIQRRITRLKIIVLRIGYHRRKLGRVHGKIRQGMDLPCRPLRTWRCTGGCTASVGCFTPRASDLPANFGRAEEPKSFRGERASLGREGD